MEESGLGPLWIGGSRSRLPDQRAAVPAIHPHDLYRRPAAGSERQRVPQSGRHLDRGGLTADALDLTTRTRVRARSVAASGRSLAARACRNIVLLTPEGAPSAMTRVRCYGGDCAPGAVARPAARSFLSRCQTASFFVPAAHSCVRVVPALRTCSHRLLTRPGMRGQAERREAHCLRCRARTARRHACEA